MKPILYSPTETEYRKRGIGTIADAASCVVTEERNGKYELTMTLPVTSRHFAQLRYGCQILAKPNPFDRPQPFKIYDISKPMRGLVTVQAEHKSYALSGIPIGPFTASSAATAVQRLNSVALVTNPFTFETDVATVSTMNVKVPTAIRAIMGGSSGSLIDHYGGEYHYDRFLVQLLKARGADRGYRITYGKNLTDLRQEENISSVYTGVLPYWYNESGGLVQGDIQYAPGTFDEMRILPLDLSSEFSEKPTKAQVEAAGARYVSDNKIGVPKVSIKVSTVPPDALGLKSMEDVALCDTVQVYFERLGIETRAKVVAVEYDALRERYISVELGDARTSIAKTIAGISAEAKKAVTADFMQQTIMVMTAAILGASGGAVRLLDTNNDGMPDTLYIADNPDPASAVKVWRFNYEGWGASQNGYNGPFTMGATFASGIIADFITAGTLNAENINVTNINGANIKNGTIGSNPLASSAVTSAKIDSGAVTAGKIGTGAVTNVKIGDSAVSYGKTSFTGTLDQVGTNKSNIEAINNLFATTLTTVVLRIGTLLQYQNKNIVLDGGYLRYTG